MSFINTNLAYNNQAILIIDSHKQLKLGLTFDQNGKWKSNQGNKIPAKINRM